MRKKWRSIKYISLNKENDQNMWTKIYHDKKRWKLTGKNMNDLNKNNTTIWEAFKYCLAILSVKGGWGGPFLFHSKPFLVLFQPYLFQFVAHLGEGAPGSKEARKIRQKWYKVAHQTNCGSMKQSFLSFWFSSQFLRSALIFVARW